MDLRPRLELAGNSLMALLDPEHDLMPTGGYEVAHDLGRWWDAALRLEECIGYAIPAELEAASLANLQRLTDNPDRLLMNRADVEWTAEGAKINPHNFRETMLAYGGLVRRRNSAWAREAGATLVRAMDRCLRPDGRLDLTNLGSWGALPSTTDPSHSEPMRDGWFDGTATGGRCIEALVWFYEATGDELALDVARRLAEHHLRNTIDPTGAVRREIVDPVNVGHCHSYHGTLRGLLLLGLLTGQREYVDAVEATYRNGVRHRLVKESGWAPHDMGETRFPNEYGDPVTDPASTGDSTQIALWLALHAGCSDLLDDVERYVRARLIPAQLTKEDAEPGREFSVRELGAWSIHGPTHAGKGCTPDVLAAVTHSLCDIQHHVCTRTPLGVRVNLHFGYDGADVTVVDGRSDRGQVSVATKRGGPVMIRVPGWASEASVTVAVDGRDVPLTRMGAFARIPGDLLSDGSQVVASYDLPERSTDESMPSGRRYRFSWRGDEIVGIDPQDGPLPFYASAAT